MFKSKYWQWGSPFFIVFILTISFGASVVRVSGQSMMPTLQDGQWLLIHEYPVWLERFGLSVLQRGDIVTFRAPREKTTSRRFVKRLVATPGDSVSVKDDVLVLNNETIQEPDVARDSSPYADNFPEVLLEEGEIVALEGYALAELPDYLKPTLRMLEPIPEAVLKQSYSESLSHTATLKLEPGYYFVLGNNRTFNASEDSRVFGPIAARAITGRAPLKNQRESVMQQGQIR